MDAPVVAALISGPLSFGGAVLGVVLTNRLAARKHLDETIEKAVEHVFGDNEALAQVAYNHLENILLLEGSRLTKVQKSRILTSSHAYLSRDKGGSVDES